MNSTTDQQKSNWSAGIARRIITPGSDVELAGLGYYLNRTAERIRDDLTATALVISDVAGQSVVLIAMDLMYNDAKFTQAIRAQVAASTHIPAQAICVNFSHSHNAPTAGYARGVGELNPAYLEFAAKQAAEAAIEAWQRRVPVRLRVGAGEITEISFNRTRENGPVDHHLSVLRADTLDETPLAVAINFHCHLNAHLDLDFRAVSRDWSGEVIDQIETALPGVTAIYLQGTCGDVMVSPAFASTERRFEVAQRVTTTTLDAWKNSKTIDGGNISGLTRKIKLPTRRWSREEVMQFRAEGLHRLATGDTDHWLDGLARSIVTYPGRLPVRYGGSVEKAVAALSKFAVEWSEEMLLALKDRPEFVETELQALRIGDVWFIAHESELFTSFGLALRHRWPDKDLFMLGYSNGSIGYLPDAHDIERRSYAAEQSPKFTGQFPFTAQAGAVMVSGMLDTLTELKLNQ